MLLLAVLSGRLVLMVELCVYLQLKEASRLNLDLIFLLIQLLVRVFFNCTDVTQLRFSDELCSSWAMWAIVSK